MSTFNRTPSGERIHISIFGRRNAGKSSLVNALTSQNLAIVSSVPGTTTDPVSKAMEILPLGPVVLTDTAGLDDTGNLGDLRVARTLRVLEKTDLAILVIDPQWGVGDWEVKLADMIDQRKVPTVVVVSKLDINQGEVPPAIVKWCEGRGYPWTGVSSVTMENVNRLRESLAEALPGSSQSEPSIVGDLVNPGDVVVMVVPIDQAAPKGRLILPQVLTIRDVLDNDAVSLVVKERELKSALERLAVRPRLVITDSQAFLKTAADTPRDVLMTGFSVLMARYRGELEGLVRGLGAVERLEPGDRVLIAEGCTHHRQADDIGSVQIPRWLRQKVGGDLHFGFSSGIEFPPDASSYDLIIHCGACTLNRREVVSRQRKAAHLGVPLTNYGLFLAWVHGVLDRALEPFPQALAVWQQGERTVPIKPPRRQRRISGQL